eukprot:GHVT01069244.1.p1 GENE.GHVT01069244.1~~GHVT01069244.1.p1  ORF type:complete len:297 (-),score=-4.04 GHVT01069244.1:998-1762(-)
MWVELMDHSVSDYPKCDLETAQPTEVEIRLIIWGARKLSPWGQGPRAASSKEFFDSTFRVTLDCHRYQGKYPRRQETDVHYHSQTGNVTFNWRVVYPRIATPLTSCLMQIAAYEHKNIGRGLFIGEANLELCKYIDKVGSTLTSLEIDSEVRLVDRSRAVVNPDDVHAGLVQLTIQFLAQSEADGRPVGIGRELPNRDPRLSVPEAGRQWGDILGSLGARADFRPLWFWIRVAFVIFLAMFIFIIGCIYPALFF